MKRTTKKVVLWSGVSMIVLTATGFIYVWFFIMPHLFEPGPIKAVKPTAWANMRVGMSKEEVIRVLGDSPSKGGPTTEEVCGKKITIPEFWEYNWTDGLAVISPSDKAYAVYFGPDGRVSEFRAPPIRTATSVANQSSTPTTDVEHLNHLLTDFHLSPQEADLVALCNVDVESNRVLYTISEVWKGRQYLPTEFKNKPEGMVIINEKQEPDTVYGGPALVWYKGTSGSTNILANNSCRSVAFVENGSITSSWQGLPVASVALDQLRGQITK
jgi:hypothetical protein